MTTKDLLIGETRHFSLYPSDNSLIVDITAEFHLISPSESTPIVGVVLKSTDNSHFNIVVPTTGLKAQLYELRVLATYLDNSMTECVYKEKLNITK